MRNKTKLISLIVVMAIALAAWLGLDMGRLTSMLPQPPKPAATTSASDVEWSEATAPDYVVQTGAAEFSEQALAATPGTVENEVDMMRRPTDAYANITHQMMTEGSARERDDLPNPTGWPKNAEVDIELSDGSTYHGWLWNRSHLIAKSLGGPDTKDNLVAGTRTQNVGNNDGTGGMGLPETLAREWLANHQDGTILYEARPNYLEGDVIPRTVTVDMRTSDGSIDARYVVYNAAKGFGIDYTNSTWWETK